MDSGGEEGHAGGPRGSLATHDDGTPRARARVRGGGVAAVCGEVYAAAFERASHLGRRKLHQPHVGLALHVSGALFGGVDGGGRRARCF